LERGRFRELDFHFRAEHFEGARGRHNFREEVQVQLAGLFPQEERADSKNGVVRADVQVKEEEEEEEAGMLTKYI
jgi:hypothetical protein